MSEPGGGEGVPGPAGGGPRAGRARGSDQTQEFPIVCTGRVGARSFRMSVQDVGREGLLAVLRPGA